MMLSGEVGVVWPNYDVFYHPSSSGTFLPTSKRTPGEKGSVFTRLAKSVAKTLWKWKESQTDTREAQVGPDLWDRIYIRKTQTLSDPRRPQRTRDTSHAQAEMGTASAGSRQVSLTRSQTTPPLPRRFSSAVSDCTLDWQSVKTPLLKRVRLGHLGVCLLLRS